MFTLNIIIARFFLVLWISCVVHGLYDNYKPIHYQEKVLAYDGYMVKLVNESELNTHDIFGISGSCILVRPTAEAPTWEFGLELQRTIEYIDGIALPKLGYTPTTDSCLRTRIIYGKYIRGERFQNDLEGYYYLGHDPNTGLVQWYPKLGWPPADNYEDITWHMHPDILIAITHINSYYDQILDPEIQTYRAISTNETLYFHPNYLLSTKKRHDVNHKFSVFKFTGKFWKSPGLYFCAEIGEHITESYMNPKTGLEFVPQDDGSKVIVIEDNRKFELVVRTDIEDHPVYLRLVEFDWNSPDMGPLPLDTELCTNFLTTRLSTVREPGYMTVAMCQEYRQFHIVAKELYGIKDSTILEIMINDDGFVRLDNSPSKQYITTCDTSSGYWICITKNGKRVQLMKKKGYSTVLFKLLPTLPPK